eukprot:6067855-Amphidinium_carterae.1
MCGAAASEEARILEENLSSANAHPTGRGNDSDDAAYAVAAAPKRRLSHMAAAADTLQLPPTNIKPAREQTRADDTTGLADAPLTQLTMPVARPTPSAQTKQTPYARDASGSAGVAHTMQTNADKAPPDKPNATVDTAQPDHTKPKAGGVYAE